MKVERNINKRYGETAEVDKRKPTKEDYRIGKWLSAALEDYNVCKEMKRDVRGWFNSFSWPNQHNNKESLNGKE